MSDNKIFSIVKDFNNKSGNYQKLLERFGDAKNEKSAILDHDTAANLKVLPPEVREEVIKGLYLNEKNIQEQQKRVAKIRQDRYNIREGRKKNKQREAAFYGKVKDFGEQSYGWMSTISAVVVASFAFIAVCTFAPGIINGLLGIKVAGGAIASMETVAGWLKTITIGGSLLGILTYGSKKVFEIGDREKSKRGAAIDKMQREELEECVDKTTGRYTTDIKKKIVLYPDEMGPEPTSVLTYSKLK